jgi:hypothetical protein
VRYDFDDYKIASEFLNDQTAWYAVLLIRFFR